MPRYRVLFIKKGIKIGQVVPYGATKDMLIKNARTKAEARKIAKDRAGNNWVVLNIKAANTLDPDARR